MNGRLDPGGQRRGQAPGKPQTPAFNWKLIFWLFIIFFLLGPWISKQFVTKGTEISYSGFRQQLEAGNVEKVTVQGEKICGEFEKPDEKKNPQGKPVSYKEFFTYLPSFGDNKLLSMLEAEKVKIIT
jgi:cell division protease FtsH